MPKCKMFIPAICIAVFVLRSFPAFAQLVDTAWVRTYDGPGGDWDRANAMAVDNSGNVYVTGESMGDTTYYDYATIKYYPNGGTAWVRRFNGQGNWYDNAFDIAIDGSGNVYVTGRDQDSLVEMCGFVTVKYYSEGSTAWVRKYAAPGLPGDIAWAIALDGSGNVYVTGSANDDYATVKYSPSGSELWVRTYDGPISGFDQGCAITVDGSGNAYVTGESRGGSGNEDYATIKYYPNGDTAWVRRYNGPADGGDAACAIAVDNSGNVYVSGDSYDGESGLDIATIKYDSSGNELWVSRYTGSKNPLDWARWVGIALDDSGNVYVTGEKGTVKYDSDGSQLWARSWAGRDIALDPFSNVYVTAPTGTVKYDSCGNQLWMGPWGGLDIALDGANNVCVAGGGPDYITIKYVQLLEDLKVYDPGTGENLILSWTPSSLSDLQGYNVYRSETSGGPYSKVNETLVTDTVYLDTGLQLNTIYYYYVGAVAPGGEFRYTEEDSGIARYPVVLVHGLNSDHTAWETMESYLDSDGFEHVWAPDLDGRGGHQENATNLNIFIEAQKDAVMDSIENTYGFPDVRPNMVNLIGHSMGGIISRLYVHNFNQNVEHLIMLGTPNGGNWSAKLRASLRGACDAIKQLTPKFMTQVFDIEWAIDNVPGVHYHEVAGDYPKFHWPWCTYVYMPNDPSPNDLVVAVSSVFHSPAEDQIKTEIYHDNHFTINENQETYERCIYPWLMGSAAPECASTDENHLTEHSTGEDDTLEQFLPTHLDSVFPAENKQHVLIVDSCEVARLGISWFEGNLDVVLYDPYGSLIDSAYAESNDSVVRAVVEEDDSYRMEFYAIANPIPGNWIMEVQGVSVPDSGEKYWIEGIVENNLRLVGRTDSDFYSLNDTVIVTGELKRDTVAVVGADVSAKINKPDESFEDLTLFDDGLHHDGQANDGVYADIFTNTSLYGSYGVAITVSGSLKNTTFSRESFFGFVVSDITFIRGDANRDGQIDIADAVYLINYLFIGGPAPVPLWLGDCNCDDVVNIADAVYLINYLFGGGPPPGCP